VPTITEHAHDPLVPRSFQLFVLLKSHVREPEQRAEDELLTLLGGAFGREQL
jgi:hypothetical protein